MSDDDLKFPESLCKTCEAEAEFYGVLGGWREGDLRSHSLLSKLSA